MIVEFINSTVDNGWGVCSCFTIKINNETVFVISDGGEPEDKILGRDLSDICTLPEIITKICLAVKQGEKVTIIHNIDEVQTERFNI